MQGLIVRFVFTVLTLLAVVAQAAPTNFEQAKRISRDHIYHDQSVGKEGTIYCGCDWSWVGRSGGRVNHESCGYEIRAQKTRADRTEWEHIFAASHFGQQRQCWQNGGRKNCTANDPVFSRMEADLHNLAPSIGEMNADRSNYNFGMVSGVSGQYGQCTSKTDFKNRTFEPRDEVKGMVARVQFYMADHYNLRLSQQQQRLYMAWDKQFPVSEWELERDRRIAKYMGHSNPFVTGEQTWKLGHKNRGAGVADSQSQQARAVVEAPAATVKGNKNSKIYHLEHCPSFGAVSERNAAWFSSEAEAKQQGFRKAKNCP